VLPDATGSNQQTLPVSYVIPCSNTGPNANALNAIVGGVSGEGTGDIQGAGDFTAPMGDFCIQTHNVRLVPEPTSVSFILASLGLALRRRAKRKTV
jgi:hypothetical protein